MRGYVVKSNSVIFVTCIYDGYHGTIFGGRPSRKRYYVESLKSISNIGYKIFCFTSENLYDELSIQFKDIDNIFLIKKEITDYWFSNDILTLKQNNMELYSNTIFWRERNCHIMWGKTEMIKTIMCHHNPKYIFWIDAGLSSDQLFPHQYFPDNRNRNKSTGIFTTKFIDNIIKDLGGKLISLQHTRPNNLPLPEKYYSIKSNRTKDAMVAGLFGGHAQKMEVFCCLSTAKIVDMLNYKELYGEESIYSTIAHENVQYFKKILFDSFYHRDWGHLYKEDKIAFSDYFEKFIENEE